MSSYLIESYIEKVDRLCQLLHRWSRLQPDWCIEKLKNSNLTYWQLRNGHHTQVAQFESKQQKNYVYPDPWATQKDLDAVFSTLTEQISSYQPACTWHCSSNGQAFISQGRLSFVKIANHHVLALLDCWCDFLETPDRELEVSYSIPFSGFSAEILSELTRQLEELSDTELLRVVPEELTFRLLLNQPMALARYCADQHRVVIGDQDLAALRQPKEAKI